MYADVKHSRDGIGTGKQFMKPLVRHALVLLWSGALTSCVTDPAGDPKLGREIALRVDRADCGICHQFPGQDQQGNLGPSLVNVGSRLTAQEIRQQLVDSRVRNANTLMPPYGSREGLTRIDPMFRKKQLTTVELEHVVAYLVSLK